jgi:hypothetical protein
MSIEQSASQDEDMSLYVEASEPVGHVAAGAVPGRDLPAPVRRRPRPQRHRTEDSWIEPRSLHAVMERPQCTPDDIRATVSSSGSSIYARDSQVCRTDVATQHHRLTHSELQGWLPIHRAAALARPDLIEALVGCGADPNGVIFVAEWGGDTHAVAPYCSSPLQVQLRNGSVTRWT